MPCRAAIAIRIPHIVDDQAEIADELGISQLHVSRPLVHALGWLREALLSDSPPPWSLRP
jgi:RNA polymerase sigma-B factor